MDGNIDFLYKKSFNLEKPFKSKLKKEVGGFRDALIWNLWLHYLQDNHMRYDNIIIVNGDGDFVNNNKLQLQEDLLKDLEELSVPLEKIEVLSDIKSLTEKIVNLKGIENEEVIAGDIIKAELMNEMMKKVVYQSKSGLDDEFEEKVMNLFDESYEAELSHVEMKKVFNIDSMSGKKDDLYVYFTEEFSLTVTYFLPKSEYYIHRLLNIEVLDDDWNEWTMLVNEIFTIEVGFEVILNIEEEEIKEAHHFVGDDMKPEYEGSYYDDEELYK